MISNKTVFVLGAGAHASYGFPTGAGLKASVGLAIRQSMDAGSARSLLKMVERCDVDPSYVQSGRCERFVKAISNSGHSSIDAFLDTFREELGYQEIGKAGIAQVLVDSEEASKTFISTDDWLPHIWGQMHSGCHQSKRVFLEKNNVGFITFNYDRFLEKWLHHKLTWSFYPNDKDEAFAALKEIPIIHIYGDLGRYNGDPDSPADWLTSWKTIRTIFEAKRDEEHLGEARRHLEEAQVICMLGFGFHSSNIEILDLANAITQCKSRNGIVAASRFDIKGTEWAQLSKSFATARIELAHEGQQCLGALRDLPVFDDQWV